MSGFIEFTVLDTSRFEYLVQAFVALKNAKNKNIWPTEDYWLSLFDEKSRAYF